MKKRTPEEWIGFALRREDPNDPITGAGWGSDDQWLISTEALGHLAEKIREEALDDVTDAVGRVVKDNQIPIYNAIDGCRR